MAIFFRVHNDASDKTGTLYTRQFKRADESDNQPSDLVLTMTRAEWASIVAAGPTHVVIRTHEDRLNRDISAGTLYDEDFNIVGKSVTEKGNPLLFTVTPEDFQAVLDARGRS